MSQNNTQDVTTAVRIKKTIKEEKDLYVIVGEDFCCVKFAYENRPENQGLRRILAELCDAVTEGQQRLKARLAIEAAAAAKGGV